jgi:anti-sigma regulatory factor (Ser/Thr protein kinase)
VKELSELRLRCPAHSRCVGPIRRALRAFLEALGFDRRLLDDVTTAAGEALANVVEHAYDAKTEQRRDVELRARLNAGNLAVDVTDHGRFLQRAPLPGRGFGLRIIHAIVPHIHIDTSNGTRVEMRFPGPPAKK